MRGYASIACASVTALACFLPMTARADILISENFDGFSDGTQINGYVYPSGAAFYTWRGNDVSALLGNGYVTSDRYAGSAGKSYALTDTSPAVNTAPVLTATWSSPADSIVSIEWKTQWTATDLACQAFVGGGWGSAATIMNVTGGSVSLFSTDGWNLLIDQYSTDTWYTIRIDLDQAAKTFDAYVNGSLVLDNKSFVAGGVTANFIQFVGDYSAVDRNGGAVLYMDDLNVATVPEPASLGLLALAGGILCVKGRRS